MAKTSNDYFYKRQKKYLKIRQSYDEETMKGLREIMINMFREIRTECEAMYMRYADEKGLTLTEARKKISRMDVQEFRAMARKYVRERDFSRQANEDLRLYNVTMSTSRLELLQARVDLIIAYYTGKEEAYIEQRLLEAYDEELMRQAGILEMTVPELDVLQNQALSQVYNRFEGATFSEKDLRRELDQGIARSLIQGKNPKEWARGLTRFMNEQQQFSFNKAKRLAITETSRVQVLAQLDSLEKYNFKHVTVVCESTACEICAPHDGDVVALEDVRMGDNAPLWHPYCKCAIAGYVK